MVHVVIFKKLNQQQELSHIHKKMGIKHTKILSFNKKTNKQHYQISDCLYL